MGNSLYGEKIVVKTARNIESGHKRKRYGFHTCLHGFYTT